MLTERVNVMEKTRSNSRSSLCPRKWTAHQRDRSNDGSNHASPPPQKKVPRHTVCRPSTRFVNASASQPYPNNETGLPGTPTRPAWPTHPLANLTFHHGQNRLVKDHEPNQHRSTLVTNVAPKQKHCRSLQHLVRVVSLASNRWSQNTAPNAADGDEQTPAAVLTIAHATQARKKRKRKSKKSVTTHSQNWKPIVRLKKSKLRKVFPAKCSPATNAKRRTSRVTAQRCRQQIMVQRVGRTQANFGMHVGFLLSEKTMFMERASPNIRRIRMEKMRRVRPGQSVWHFLGTGIHDKPDVVSPKPMA